MVEYIRKIVTAIKTAGSNRGALVKVLAEELDRLDPRDFLPEVQYHFVILRMHVRSYQQDHLHRSGLPPMDELLRVLDHFAGSGSSAKIRSFDFIASPDLKRIIERDYRELSLILFPAGAWKSTVVLAGAILEAILVDQMTATDVILETIKSSPKAPKTKRIDKGQWSMYQLINVATDVGILPRGRSDAIDVTLREYRNVIHADVELKKKYTCTEAEASLAKGALDAVCNHLTENALHQQEPKVEDKAVENKAETTAPPSESEE